MFQQRDGGARQLPTRVRNYFKSAQPVRVLRRPPRDMFPQQEAKSFLASSRKSAPPRFQRVAKSPAMNEDSGLASLLSSRGNVIRDDR